MLRVYVAGAYSAPNVVQVLANMRRGIEASVQIAKCGMAPYCPWLDFTFGLISAMPTKVFRAISMEWLRGADVVFVVPGWENSKGTKAEIKEAVEYGIPVFFSLKELVSWAKINKKPAPPEEIQLDIIAWFEKEPIKWIGDESLSGDRTYSGPMSHCSCSG